MKLILNTACGCSRMMDWPEEKPPPQIRIPLDFKSPVQSFAPTNEPLPKPDFPVRVFEFYRYEYFITRVALYVERNTQK